jgi:Mechanosensitive ion channel, conserved TM helix
MQEKPFESVRELMNSVAAYLPTLLAGFVVLLLGLFMAWVASRIVVRLLIFMRLDRVAARLGWTDALEKGDVRHSLFESLGTLLGIVIFLIFFENALVIWHLTVLSQLLDKVVLLIPELVTAIFILLVGWGTATGVSRGVQRALFQEEFERARLGARLVRWAILVTTAAIVLVKLNIAVVIVTGAFLIAFGALALCAVLAFGLGSRRAVEMMWEERFLKKREQEKEDEKESEAAKKK